MPVYIAPEIDVSGWLKFAKHRWRQMRTDLKRKLESKAKGGMEDDDDEQMGRDGSSSATGARKPNLSAGLLGYMKQGNLTVQERPWHVVSITEEDSQPGVFRIWAFLDPTLLQSIVVHVPRVVYVNMRTPRDSLGRRVERLLPRGRPCLNLYEVKLPESEWEEQSKDLINILHDVNVEGFYETHLSLGFRFIMEAGCVTRVNKPRYRADVRAATAAGAAGASSLPLSLDHLDLYTGADTPPYMAHAVYRKIFCYHSFARYVRLSSVQPLHGTLFD